jgi:hypothetical protein
VTNYQPIAVLAGALVLLLLGTTAQAKPAPPPAPYTLGAEIISQTVFVPVSVEHPSGDVTVTCPEGKVVTGGGFQTKWPTENSSDGALETPIRQSYPSAPNAWTVRTTADWQGSSEHPPNEVTAYAVCVNAAAPTS